ncbi:MAG: hypothetical protein H0W25_00630, partial [Acidimicrobiia bacterium]|nr:hypothetical protein [Acidimicrobiia bacterium]
MPVDPPRAPEPGWPPEGDRPAAPRVVAVTYGDTALGAAVAAALGSAGVGTVVPLATADLLTRDLKADLVGVDALVHLASTST